MGDITADKLTKAYIKIRDERARLSADYKEKDSVLSRQQESQARTTRLLQCA